MTEFRVLVTGSRDWPSEALVWEALAFVCAGCLTDGGTLTVVHGDCPTGADLFAHTWFDLPIEPEYTAVEESHPADWQRACDANCYHRPRPDGRCPMAGHLRNQPSTRR